MHQEHLQTELLVQKLVSNSDKYLAKEPVHSTYSLYSLFDSVPLFGFLSVLIWSVFGLLFFTVVVMFISSFVSRMSARTTTYTTYTTTPSSHVSSGVHTHTHTHTEVPVAVPVVLPVDHHVIVQEPLAPSATRYNLRRRTVNPIVSQTTESSKPNGGTSGSSTSASWGNKDNSRVELDDKTITESSTSVSWGDKDNLRVELDDDVSDDSQHTKTIGRSTSASWKKK